MKRITMKELAKEAGVSVATVSLVLNNKAQRLSPETILRVERLADELGFISNLHAKSLKTNQSQTIGLILPDITNQYFMQIAKNIEYYLKEAGYLLLLTNTDGIANNEIQAIKRFRQLHVERIILVASDVSTYQFIQDYGMNDFVIFLDRVMNPSSFWRVECDDYQGGMLAAKEFIRYQHRHIICITGPSHFLNVQERLTGFQDAYKQSELDYDIVCLEGDFSIQSGIYLAEKIFQHPYKALFFLNDLMATGFYRACLDQGVTIADHYAMIGYDDIDVAQYLNPPLTTIRQPIEAMAMRVIEFILHQTEIKEKLPVTLISRQSLFMAKE